MTFNSRNKPFDPTKDTRHPIVPQSFNPPSPISEQTKIIIGSVIGSIIFLIILMIFRKKIIRKLGFK